MNALLPIIEELAAARDDAARAAWLLRCPVFLLGKYQFAIANRLRNAGFSDGIAYLQAELNARHAVRDEAGELSGFPAEVLKTARRAMAAIAAGAAPDPTEI